MHSLYQNIGGMENILRMWFYMCIPSGLGKQLTVHTEKHCEFPPNIWLFLLSGPHQNPVAHSALLLPDRAFSSVRPSFFNPK
jgi:hypothetical protein